MTRLAERRRALRERHGDRGATAVEFALIAPVLALLVIGFIDFSLVIAGNNAGSNAVRDGVRVGIVDFVDADVAGSTNRQAIEAAVGKRISGLVKGDYTVTVRCLRAADKAPIPCKVPDEAGPAGVNLDVDLLEVRLDWKQIVITPLAATNHTETIRMTITGRPDFSLDPTPLSVYFDDPDRDGQSDPVTVDEPNGPVNLVLRRSGDSLPAVTVALQAYLPGAGGAQPADFSIPISATFPSGVDQVTVPVTIVDDDLVEPDETFGVELTTPIDPTSAVIGLPQRVLILIRSEDVDSTPPGLEGASFVETGSPDGRVDEIRVRFDEPVATLGTWTLSGPAGTSMGSVTLGADSQTVVIAVAGGSRNTGGAFTVTGSGVSDAQGNTTNPGAVSAADAAAPVLVAVASTDGDHEAESGDVLTFTFSEPVNVANGATTLTLSNGGGNDHIAIDRLLGDSTTGADYVGNGNGNQTYAFNATLAGSGTTSIMVTLVSGNASSNTPSGSVAPALGLVPTGVSGPGGTPVAMNPLTGWLF